MVKKSGDTPFETVVEQELAKLLKDVKDPADRIKALAVAVRWLAVKARVVLPSHGSGFDELEEGL